MLATNVMNRWLDSS